MGTSIPISVKTMWKKKNLKSIPQIFWLRYTGDLRNSVVLPHPSLDVHPGKLPEHFQRMRKWLRTPFTLKWLPVPWQNEALMMWLMTLTKPLWSWCSPPTERGVKHIRELIKAKKAGYHAILAFVKQMDGVEVLFLLCHVEPDELVQISHLYAEGRKK